MNYDDHVQLESYEEDEVIIRVINRLTQELVDLEEQRMEAHRKLIDAMETYRVFLERESHEAAKRTGQYEEPTF